MALMRLVMKPGDSLMSTVSLPIAAARAVITCTVSSVVSSAWTISTSFILCTGLKKCIPPIRPGRSSTAAISVMLSAEVFDATTASAGAAACTAARSASLRSIFSGAASMMTPTPDTASATEVVVESRPIIAAASSGATLPSSTPLATMPWTAVIAFWSGASATS